MKRLVLLVVLCFSATMFAQGPGGPGEQGPPPPGAGGPETRGGMMMRHPGMGGEMGMHADGMDPLHEAMFPPDFILEHAQEINLTTEQKTAIRNEVKTTQSKFTDLQFQLQDETQAFATLLKQPKVDEKQALAELDKVLDLERQIKRLHVGMAIRVRNQLTQEQLDKLKQLHMQAMRMRMMRDGGMMERHERRPDGGQQQPQPKEPQQDQ
jgi:Spy/CpxP family protein refolding chaperone